jgi:tripartite-type tricarboxylate transporter receptor subunit TctC
MEQRPTPTRPRGRLASVARAALRIALLTAAATAHAQSTPPASTGAGDWPSHPIRVVVPYSAGGGTDILARLIGVRLGQKLGQAVIIDNKPGAATAVGSENVARAAPDGYTVLMTSGTLTVLPALYPGKLNFDPLKDLAPVTLFATSPNVLLVHPSVPAHTLQEFLDYARSRSDPLNYGSSGNGGTGHLAMEMLKQQAHVEMVHIPYKGGGPAMNALLAGQVSAMINNVAAAVPLIKAGKVRAIAMTSLTRSPALPDVPTIAESGIPGFDANAWFGALVPAGTPPAIVEILSRDINEIVQSAEISQKFALQGVDAAGDTPAQFAKLLREDLARWQQVVKTAHITPD